MPRTARASVGGVCYHAINRGNGRSRVFHDEADYQAFVDLFEPAVDRIPMRIVGGCLMPNHFHLVLRPREDGDLYCSRLLTVLRYVERNPLRAGMVERAEDWPWSSLAWRQAGGLVRLDKEPADRPEPWVQRVNAAETEKELQALRRCVHRGTPFGSPT